jgi:hypothetical protein
VISAPDNSSTSSVISSIFLGIYFLSILESNICHNTTQYRQINKLIKRATAWPYITPLNSGHEAKYKLLPFIKRAICSQGLAAFLANVATYSHYVSLALLGFKMYSVFLGYHKCQGILLCACYSEDQKVVVWWLALLLRIRKAQAQFSTQR